MMKLDQIVKMPIALWLLVLLITFALGGCLVGDDSVELNEAYSEIGAAIDYRATQCGNRPAYPLIIPGAPSTYGTRLCSASILREACPFNDYPLFCLEMYTVECNGKGPNPLHISCDLPMIGP